MTEKIVRQSTEHKKMFGHYTLIEIITIVCVVLIGIYAWNKHEQGSGAAAPAEHSVGRAPSGAVYIVDYGRLLRSEINVVLSGNDPTGKNATNSGAEFGRKFNKVMAEYRANGDIVLSAAAVLAYPNAIDITSAVAEKMEVKLGQ